MKKKKKIKHSQFRFTHTGCRNNYWRTYEITGKICLYLADKHLKAQTVALMWVCRYMLSCRNISQMLQLQYKVSKKKNRSNYPEISSVPCHTRDATIISVVSLQSKARQIRQDCLSNKYNYRQDSEPTETLLQQIGQ